MPYWSHDLASEADNAPFSDQSAYYQIFAKSKNYQESEGVAFRMVAMLNGILLILWIGFVRFWAWTDCG